jgi:phosphoribosylformimino-5-aminoimidazole carboxamide ribotide isomerase
MMLVLPAIDIINGACVRLTKGDFRQKKTYFSDPFEVAKRWISKGAEWIHIIDLDGARSGIMSNLSIASRIKNDLDVRVQYGGGIRNPDAVEKVLSEGIDRAILGTRIIEDRGFLESCSRNYNENIIISLDYGKNGMIYKNGWKNRTSNNIFDFLKILESLEIREIIVTDINRDGTMKGPYIGFLKKLLMSTNINFIVAGGIADIEDIKQLKKIESYGISGVITGKALYEGKKPMDLGEAIKIGSGK